jgi:magnesium chelatase family protein
MKSPDDRPIPRDADRRPPYSAVTSVMRSDVGAALVVVHAVTSEHADRLVVAGPDGGDLHETRDRIRAASVNSGLPTAPFGVEVRITPSDLQAPRSVTDLAAAAAVLAMAGLVPAAALRGVVIIGELGLDGTVRPVNAVFTMVWAAVHSGARFVVVPAGNAEEAALVQGARVVSVGSLNDFVSWACADGSVPETAGLLNLITGPGSVDDLMFVPAALGDARFAVEVAATGRHHLSLTAADATATMLARSLPTLLPAFDDDTAEQVTKLHDLAGRPTPSSAPIRRPVLVTPPRGLPRPALVGSRTTPGAVSLADQGVLLLQNAPEFDSRTLQALREPLDTGRIRLATGHTMLAYPAQFQLVVTALPCPCGRDTTDCCSAARRRRYRDRLRVLDAHLDIRVTLPTTVATDTQAGQSSAQVAVRVAAARAAAVARWADHGWATNSEVPLERLVSGRYRLAPTTTASLRRLIDVGTLTTGYGRIMRLAWTVSDLRGSGRPDLECVEMARDLYLGGR